MAVGPQAGRVAEMGVLGFRAVFTQCFLAVATVGQNMDYNDVSALMALAASTHGWDRPSPTVGAADAWCFRFDGHPKMAGRPEYGYTMDRQTCLQGMPPTALPCDVCWDNADCGWVGVTCMEAETTRNHADHPTAISLPSAALSGNLLWIFGQLTTLVDLNLAYNPDLGGDLYDLRNLVELRNIILAGCPNVRGDVRALTFVPLGASIATPCSCVPSQYDDCGRCVEGQFQRPGEVHLEGSGVHGPISELLYLPHMRGDHHPTLDDDPINAINQGQPAKGRMILNQETNIREYHIYSESLEQYVPKVLYDSCDVFIYGAAGNAAGFCEGEIEVPEATSWFGNTIGPIFFVGTDKCACCARVPRSMEVATGQCVATRAARPPPRSLLLGWWISDAHLFVCLCTAFNCMPGHCKLQDAKALCEVYSFQWSDSARACAAGGH